MSSLIGQSLGRYKILEQLGEGGMATVYKAYDSVLDRNVAIKLIRTDQFAPNMLEEMLKRFEREAKALAKLSHPNIVHVHDYGDFNGAPYLVMEYLPSGTLKQGPPTPMPWQQAVRIILPIAQALAYAHEHNIIHRDIKPANILLTEKGLPMLSDFGIAKILESGGTATITGAGMTIGTPEYMAPEQWTGEASPRSDIYSLGVVLYELITGRKPFVADTPMAVMLKQINDTLPRPTQFISDMPADLENVLLRALAKRPEDRYQNMAEFAAALDEFSGGQTLSAALRAQTGQTGQSLETTGRPAVQEQMATVMAGGKNLPAATGTGEVPSPPPEQPGRSWLSSGRWILVGGLSLVLCIGVVLGGTLIIRGLTSSPPIAPDSTSTLAQSVNSTSASPLPLAASSTPSTNQAAQTVITPTATTTTPASQVTVLWDISHGPRQSSDGSPYTPNGMYSSLSKALAGQNYIITQGDLTNLNSYQILVLSATSASQMAYGTNEANAIDQFVRISGHSLLILSDIPGFENLIDPVSSKFSIGLGELTTDGPASLSPEPFFSGVNSLKFLFGAGVFLVSAPSQTAAVDKSGNAVIAFCECDAGRVLAISDSNLWDNRGLNQADNRRFAIEAFKWLARVNP